MEKKILLVDDVRLFLQLEETFFKRTGCQIFTASSGTEALEKTEKHKPDLILLDYIMPDMMGDEVCRKIRAADWGKNLSIIIVSTSSDDRHVARCFEAGANDYITKPINAQEVLAKAAFILGIPQRIHYRIPVNFKMMGQASGVTFTGFSRNISRGGILIECQNKLDQGSLMVMDLPLLEQSQSVTLKGQVMRLLWDEPKQSYLLGIRFVEMEPDKQAAVNKFIDSRKVSTYDY